METDLSFYPQPEFESAFPADDLKLLFNELENASNSREVTDDLFASQEMEDFVASPLSLDPGSPCSLTTLQDANYLTDEELTNLPVRELNKRMRNLPSCEVLKLRKRRRSLKNRGYASNCRKKRQMHRTTLEEEKELLHKQLDEVNAHLDQTRRERDMYKEKYEELQKRWKTYCSAATFMTLRR